jgi:hypothetical protein
MSERLTVDEFLGMFGRPATLGRWVVAADSEEYLTLITYLVERQNHQ